MRLQDGMGAMPARSAWRFFPWFLALGMSVVIAVNIGMAYTALHTFPGIAGSDGFDLSNHYDKVIDRVARDYLSIYRALPGVRARTRRLSAEPFDRTAAGRRG